jgi:hypothetical protein
VATLTAAGQCISGSGNFGTIVQSTVVSSVLFALTGNGECVQNMDMSLSTMNDGWAIFLSGGKDDYVQQINFANAPGIVAMNGTTTPFLRDLRCTSAAGGTPALLNVASGTTKAGFFAWDATSTPGLHMYDVTCGFTGSPIATLLDGHVDTDTFIDDGFNNPGVCIQTQDSGNVGLPNFIYAYKYGCQTPNGLAGFNFVNSGTPSGGGSDYYFFGAFCNAASNWCVITNSDYSRINFVGADFNGAGAGIMLTNAAHAVLNGGHYWNGGQSGVNSCTGFSITNNYCSGIVVGATANDTKISNIDFANATGTGVNIGNDAYGIDVMSGATQTRMANITPGGTVIGGWVNEAGANTCGDYANTTVIWAEAGPCVVEGADGTASGHTIAAANMVNLVPGGEVDIWRSPGAIGAFNDTTDTAANLITALGATAYVGQTWRILMYNGDYSTGNQTLSGGTGVTMSANQTAPGQWKYFLCRVTNLSAAVTCAGQ